MTVRKEAPGISRRPKIAPLPVTWPSPLTPVKWPLTLSRPQKFLILNLTVERLGSRLHTPAVSGSFSSVSTLVMGDAPPALFGSHCPVDRRCRASWATLLLPFSGRTALLIVAVARHGRRSLRCRLAHYRREF